MVGPGRKSVEPIALLIAHGDASGLQKFMNVAPLVVRRRAGRGPRHLRRHHRDQGRRVGPQ
jgi:hypothetical protein